MESQWEKNVDVAVEEFQNAEPEDNGEYGQKQIV